MGFASFILTPIDVVAASFKRRFSVTLKKYPVHKHICHPSHGVHS